MRKSYTQYHDNPGPVAAMLTIAALLGSASLVDCAGPPISPIDQWAIMAESHQSPDRLVLREFRLAIATASNHRLSAIASRINSAKMTALWELHQRTLKKTVSLESKLYQMGQLVGKLEGEYDVAIPVWWKLGLISAQGNITKTEMQPLLRDFARESPLVVTLRRSTYEIQPLFMSRSGPGGLFGPTDLGIRPIRTGIEITRKSGRGNASNAAINRLDEMTQLASFFQVTFTASEMFVATGDRFGYPYGIASIDPVTGELRWIQRVWSLGRTDVHSFSGYWSHDCEIVASSKYVAVFGRIGSAYYFEVFDTKSGRVKTRFATTLWSFD